MPESKPSPSLSALPPVPCSPTMSFASTTLPISYYLQPSLLPPPSPHNSVLNAASLEASQNAYSTLLQSAKTYRLSLAALSASASKFGRALEACARLKEARNKALEGSHTGSQMRNSGSSWHSEAVGEGNGGDCTADSLLAASGVHQLIANHQQILSETIYKNFEVPLLHELDQWQRRLEEEEVSYQREAKAMNKEIRRMEKNGSKLHKTQKRDLGHFREHLVQLMGKIDELTGLSDGHGKAMVRDCQDMSRAIVECSAGIVRAEVQIFDALARKGNHGGGLDKLLRNGRDFFADEERLEGSEGGSNNIFPIKPPLVASSLSAEEVASFDPSLRKASSDSLRGEEKAVGSQSLAGTACDPDDTGISSELDNSTGILNRPRPTKPFSPTLGEGKRMKDPLQVSEGRKNAEGGNESSCADADEDEDAKDSRITTVPKGADLETCEEDTVSSCSQSRDTSLLNDASGSRCNVL